MKKHTRIFAMLLAAMMAASALAGCDNKNKDNSNNSDNDAKTSAGDTSKTEAVDGMEGNLYLEGVPIVKDKETYKIAVLRSTRDKSDNFNEKICYKNAEAETNIHIEWVEIVETAATEKVPILLASDLPDAFLQLLNESHVAKNFSQLVVLDDMMEKYAPHITEQYNGIPDMWDMMKFPDGHQYTLAGSLATSHDDDGGPMISINTEWLKKVGKEVPKTTEEFYEVLKAFKEQDPNGNGKADEIPLEICDSYWAGNMMCYSGSWGFGRNYTIENGKFIPTVNTQAFRDFIDFYHKLYSEGLMDPEAFSQTSQQYTSKVKENICGVFGNWTPQSWLGNEFGDKFTPIMPLEAPGYEGKAVKAGQWGQSFANRTMFSITKACKSPQTLVRWWDYLSSDTKRKWTICYGEEGKLWEMRDDGKIWSIFPKVTGDYTREDMKYSEGAWGHQPLILDEESEMNDPELYPNSVIRYNFSESLKPYYEKEILPIRFVDPEKTSEKAMIETDLNTYIKNFLATSIINGVDDKAWEAHLKQLDSLGIDQWTQWYQDFIDKKF